jgi:hypothetical protein
MIRNLLTGVIIIGSAAVLSAQTPVRYDRAAEKTISGTIKAVVAFPAEVGGVGVHFDLKTADGLVSVHVAPALYIGQQNAFFFADDQIEVIGTRTVEDGNVAIWAKAIQKGNTLLVLREADGTPKWDATGDATDGCGVNHTALPANTER